MPSQRYDLHTHSEYSDASSSIEEIVTKAKERKLVVIAITDHFWPSRGSQRGGVGIIRQRRREIKRFRSVTRRLRILDGAEVDILSDGDIAGIAGGHEQFDILIGSIHWGSDSRTWASAVVGAASRHDFDILGHYDGYLTSYREKDGRQVAEALASNDIAVELSSRYPPQNESFLELAREAGCSFIFGSDAHMPREVGDIQKAKELAAALGLDVLSSSEVVQKFG